MASSTNISEVNSEFRVDDKDTKLLYEAITAEREQRVVELCQEDPRRLFKVVTIHKDTVLHMAIYFQKVDTMVDLLRLVPQGENHKLATTNEAYNTILHEAATSDTFIDAVEKMLEMEPNLLELCNNFKESPIYRAARFGQREMFKFLDNKIKEREFLLKKSLKSLYRRHEGNTVLHAALNAAVSVESLDIATEFATSYPDLVGEIDPHTRMTAFQLLACKPEAFRRRDKRRWPCKRRGSLQQEYDAAVRLANLLVDKDTTWKNTKAVEESNQPKTDNYGDGDRTSKGNIAATPTPLFLATQNGCQEIVEAILQKYPSAVEHIDDKRRTILHVAIMYRQMEILEYVERRKIPMRRLRRKLDSDGNSILHMVGTKPEASMGRRNDDTQRPAFQLRGEILFFERIQEICSDAVLHNKNNSNQTAEELFAKTNNQLLERSNEWIKRTAEQCSLVAVFIATVAFAAAYTIPGGPNQSTGFPILLDQPLFFIFTISDVLCLTSSLTSVIMFLSILTSPLQLWDFKRSLLLKLMLGIMFLMLSVSMMMLGFAATIILMIRKREQSTKIALYAASFLPATIFALSQLRLFWSLMETFYLPRKGVAVSSSCCSFPSLFFSLINPLKKIAGSLFGKLIKSKPQPTPPPPPLPPPPPPPAEV